VPNGKPGLVVPVRPQIAFGVVAAPGILPGGGPEPWPRPIRTADAPHDPIRRAARARHFAGTHGWHAWRKEW